MVWLKRYMVVGSTVLLAVVAVVLLLGLCQWALAAPPYSRPQGYRLQQEQPLVANPISITKELVDVPSGLAVVSDTISYTIHINNVSSGWLTPVTITVLPLWDYWCPACALLTSWSITPTSIVSDLGQVYWSDVLSPALGGPGVLRPGEGLTVTVDFHPRLAIDQMYWKEKFHDYALSGMPDIDQQQDQWGSPVSPPTTLFPPYSNLGLGYRWTYCGPVAAANSLWWFDSEFEDPGSPPPPAISDSYPLVQSYADHQSGEWDDHDSENVQPLVEDLAGLMGTSHVTGTKVISLASGIEAYIARQGLGDAYTVTTRAVGPSPKADFPEIRDSVRASHDVILLLGFWQRQGGTNAFWRRVGGHYVTVAGVDPGTTRRLALSDPYRDSAEGALPPWWPSSPGRVRPNPHLDLHELQVGSATHNNTWYASHDVYVVDSVGGIPGSPYRSLANYAASCNYVLNFQGQNAGLLPAGTSYAACNPTYAIQTVIEYMVEVAPMTETIPCSPTNNVAVVSGARDEEGELPEAQANASVSVVRKTLVEVQKFNDLNANGTRNLPEPTLSGWAFTLYDMTGTVVMTGETAGPNGVLVLELPPELAGQPYTLCEALPEGWLNTAPPDAFQPNPGEVCKALGVVPLERRAKARFGNYLPAHLTVIKDVWGVDPGYTWPYTLTRHQWPVCGLIVGDGLVGEGSEPVLQSGRVVSTFDLGDGDQWADHTLIGGCYLLTETLHCGYGATVQCTNGWCGSYTATLPLAPGEQVTCTFTNAIPPEGEATDGEGMATEGYRPDQAVYATGQGFLPDADVDVYVTPDGCWVCCEPIADHGVILSQTVHTDGEGRISELVWPAPLAVGEYDLIFDANRDGRYTPPIDTADGLWCTLGFYVADGLAPVGGVSYPAGVWAGAVPWVLATAAVGVLMAIFWRRRG